jgi:putative membrane protein
MKKLLFSFLIAACCALTSCGNTNIQDDTKFAVEAADGGMMEVELGKLAQTNASSKQIKDFGQQMVNDHGKAGEELKMLAASKNITLPSALSNKNQDSYNDLAKKKGVDFDKAYASFMVDDHKEDIDKFKHEAEKGNDADRKNGKKK